MSEWFTRWFGREYLDLYPHRDEKEARAAIDLVLKVVDEKRARRALDLACGSGRHTRVMCKHVWTVGYDLSMALLQVARAEPGRVSYVRGDMRLLPFASEAFDVVLNLFTSFGYFDCDNDNRIVLAEVYRVIAPSGRMVLDYFNAQHVRDNLVPEDVRRVRGRVVTQRRHITPDGKYVEKHISAVGSEHTYLERVRLFAPDEIRGLLAAAGLRVTNEFGGYAGQPLDSSSSRAIFFAIKE